MKTAFVRDSNSIFKYFSLKIIMKHIIEDFEIYSGSQLISEQDQNKYDLIN